MSSEAFTTLQARDANNVQDAQPTGVNREGMFTNYTLLHNMQDPTYPLTVQSVKGFVSSKDEIVGRFDQYDVDIDPSTLPLSFQEKLRTMRVPPKKPLVIGQQVPYARRRFMRLPEIDRCKEELAFF